MSIETLFDQTIAHCRAIFADKLSDYGPTWLVFRWLSLIDQIYIKLGRLRTLEENNGEHLVEDTPQQEYYGVINYCLVGLIKETGELPSPEDVLANPDLLASISPECILTHYDNAALRVLALLVRKNHDYGDAWRSMAVSSITDQMLIKTLRIKHMLSSGLALEEANSLPAQLMDILNYCLFSLLLLEGQPC